MSYGLEADLSGTEFFTLVIDAPTNYDLLSCSLTSGCAPIVSHTDQYTGLEVAVDGQNVFWADVGNQTLNGYDLSSKQETIYAKAQYAPYHVTTDGTYVYWGDGDALQLRRAPLSGTSKVSFIASVPNPINGMVVSGDYLYYAVSVAGSSGGIYRIPSSGGTPTVFATTTSGAAPHALRLAKGAIYWVSGGSIFKKAL
jgi:hypothetical protein